MVDRVFSKKENEENAKKIKEYLKGSMFIQRFSLYLDDVLLASPNFNASTLVTIQAMKNNAYISAQNVRFFKRDNDGGNTGNELTWA